MADKQIKDFTAATTLTGTELFLIQEAGNTTKKITAANLKLYMMPIGSYYTQYYGESDPATLFGGTWAKRFDTEAVFFRTEGSASTTYEARAFDANIQDSQMQGHIHSATIPFGTTTNNIGANITRTSYSDGITPSTVSGPLTDGTNGTPRTGLETRPRNRCIRIWERTA